LVPRLYASDSPILVGVAVSASEPVKAAGKIFTAANPEAEILYSAAASGVILRQMETGAVVDVVIFADKATMDLAVSKNLVVPASAFKLVENSVVLAFDAGLAEKITRASDLPASGLAKIAIGNPEYVPLGRYVREGLEKAGIWKLVEGCAIPASSAAQSVAYLVRGEVEASFIYRTDAKKLDKAKFSYIILPAIEKAGYWAALSISGEAKPEAEAFLRYLNTKEAGYIFAEYGFEQVNRGNP
jgi:molybdate transport system substrate-binding protein